MEEETKRKKKRRRRRRRRRRVAAQVLLRLGIRWRTPRYIQGARFFGNPSITVETPVPNDDDQNLSQTAVINSKSPAIPTYPYVPTSSVRIQTGS
ncbi:hypothetical protein AAC387_Pa08g0009 [Persea americana]